MRSSIWRLLWRGGGYNVHPPQPQKRLILFVRVGSLPRSPANSPSHLACFPLLVPQFPCLRHYLPVLNPSHSSFYLLLSLLRCPELRRTMVFHLLFVLKQDKAVLAQYYRLVI